MSDVLNYPTEYHLIGKTVKFASRDTREGSTTLIFTDESMFCARATADGRPSQPASLLVQYQTPPVHS
jgi:hypothetical protein